MTVPGQIYTDLPCVRCGYNLRGLTMNDVCPECGQAVRAACTRQNLLHADPHWLRRVTTGARLAAGAAAALLLGWSAAGLFAGVESSIRRKDPVWFLAALPVLGVLSILAVLLGFVGSSMICTRNPAMDNSREGVSLRKIAKVAVWGAGAGGA